MKKFLFAILFLASLNFVNAQSTMYKPFKFDFAVGFASPSGSGTKAGVLFSLEPKYAITNNIVSGIRFEGAVMARATMNPDGQSVSGDVKANASYVATTDYFYTTKKFRPFTGAGAGLFSTAAGSIDKNSGTVTAGNKFGAIARAGFEFGHFRFATEYNIIGKTGDIKNNYIGFKIGFFAGGGRTK
jgi:outer membrane protein X